MAVPIVAPTITTANPTEYKEIIKKYYSFTKRIHIDASDGTLSPNMPTLMSETAIWWPKAERQGGGWLEFTNVHSSREKAMAPHSRTLAWKIPWTGEPGRLQSMGSLRVRHD